jgi:hypothetical protein
MVSFDWQISVVHNNALFLCDVFNGRLAVITTRTQQESNRLRMAAREQMLTNWYRKICSQHDASAQTF